MANKTIKILAIDDNSDNLIVLKALINDLFPNVLYFSANSGKTGIDLCQSEKPDVILLDIVMPGMDGYEVCKKLKSDIRLKHIPVVMVTANRADKESRVKALEAGADAFLPKPVDESELKAQIRAMLRIKESEDLKRAEKQHLEDMVLDRTEALEIELADRIKAENKLIHSLDKITKNRQAIMNLMQDLKSEMKERRKVEDNLQAERNLLRTLIDNLPDTIYILDENGRKVISNKEDLKNIRCENEKDVIGKNDLELFPGEVGKRGHADNMSVIKNETPIIDREEYFFDRNGEKHWLLTSKYPLYDASGKIKGLFGTGHDITNRKKAEEDIALKNRELLYLNSLATDLSGMSNNEDMSAFLMKRLKEFTGSEFLVFSEYDSDNQILVTRHIEADQKMLKKLISIAGDKILNRPAPIRFNDENFKEIITEVVSEKKSLTDLSFGAIPSIVDKAFGSFTGFDRYYGLSFVVAGELYGTSFLGFKNSQPTPSIELLKSFSHIAAVSLQRRKTEEKLKKSEEEYRMLIENQGEGVGIVDLNEKFVFVNPAAEEMFGVESGGLLNQNLLGFIVKDQRSKIEQETKNRSKSEKSTYEIDIVKPDGQMRTILNTATPQFDSDGNLKGTFGVFRDITDRKKMEQKLAESEAYYRTLIDISPDGIIIADLEGTVSYGSIKAYEIFGVPSGEKVTGTSVLKWIAKDSQNSIMERVTDIINGNIAPETREYKLRKFDGSEFWGELSSSPLSDSVGNSNALLIVCRDISDRKAAESELIKSKEKAEESDRLKTAFLHNISHEIRTPMNAIIGFSSMLNEPDLDKESQTSYIDIITNSSNHLLTIVSDIIEISNIEAGLLKVNKRTTNLNSLMRSMQNQHRPKASEKGIELRLDIKDSDNEKNIKTDETKVVQVLSSLLSNAVKFTSKGEIFFGYTMKKDKIEFFVSDTGIGISQEQHKRIFERFYQVENSVARQYEGTGLGLSISKAYVELLGGEIWLTSQSGKGSTFFFTIPLEGEVKFVAPEIITIKNENVRLQGKKTILIAEDEENNYRLMKAVLSHLELNLIHAENGKEAVDLCTSNKDIDLVVMDIKMPVMDGYEATSLIKKFRPSLPIIAQTAFAFESDKTKALNAGCDDYISKPVKKDMLIEMIMKYL